MSRTGGFRLEQTSGGLVIHLSGSWCLHDGLPPAREIERAFGGARAAQRLSFDAHYLGAWDTALVTFLQQVSTRARTSGLTIDPAGLPDGVRRLLALAEAVPEKKDARGTTRTPGLVERVGLRTIATTRAAGDMVAFVGEVTLALGRLLVGRARFRASDLVLFIQQAGSEALPIVTLISFLVGLILGFVGAVQLEQFGASIYVANLVGVAMVREMGAMMTAIVMAGRTGAAYAAQLGSMKVNQEIDALTTMGVSPMDFLVLPRMIALSIMMPLLCLYSDLLGILGGATMGIGLLHLSSVTYVQQTADAVAIGDLVGGIFKASVYGVLIALAGCLRGMQAGASASAVGDATTSAVVTSIVWIVSACGVFAVLFYILGI